MRDTCTIVNYILKLYITILYNRSTFTEILFKNEKIKNYLKHSFLQNLFTDRRPA